MDNPYSTQKIIALRKLTRTVAAHLHGQLKEYLAALAPLFSPRGLFGPYLQSGLTETPRASEKAFKDLKTLYQQVAATKPFNLPTELQPHLQLVSGVLETTPLAYLHPIKTERGSKSVTITAPFKWVLNYSGFTPRRLNELLTAPHRSPESLEEFVLHALMLHVAVTNQAGLGKILSALRFPVHSERVPAWGGLPITFLASSIRTFRPPDNVILESTEMSGTDVFEEVIYVEDVVKLRDPFREQLLELIKGQAPELLPA